LNEANKQRAVQEAQVGQHTAPPNVARQRLLDFRNEDRLSRRLSGIAATHPEDLLEKFLIASLPSRPHAQIVLDRPPDHRFIEIIRQFVP
jgi:hypothetical protein